MHILTFFEVENAVHSTYIYIYIANVAPIPISVKVEVTIPFSVLLEVAIHISSIWMVEPIPKVGSQISSIYISSKVEVPILI